MGSISIDNAGKKDVLGRITFARHLLDLAERVDVQSSGAVIGLEGAWGTGKTSVLNSLDSIVEERDSALRPVLIRFNPWMVSGTSGLVEALLVQMASELPDVIDSRGFLHRKWDRIRRKNDPVSVATSLIEYAGLLGAIKHLAPAANYLIPGAGLVLEATGSAIGGAAEAVSPLGNKLERWKHSPQSLSLNASRKSVEKRLNEFGRRLIVLVDDLDRLPPNEFAGMFQAIKAVADFPNVVYVLAFDPVVAEKAVKEALLVDDGKAFLEKLIQLSLPLPEIPATRLTEFALGRLRTTVSMDLLSDHEKRDLEAAWLLAVAMLKSPRDVERLRTRLLVAGPILVNAVNMADVVLLESMTLRFPKVLAWLKGNVAAIFGVGIHQFDESLSARGETGDPWEGFHLSTDERRKYNESRASEWMALLPAEPRSVVPAKAVMEFLFDKCRRQWNSAAKRSNFRRVQEFRYWYRWRCYHDHQERWPVAEIEKYLHQPTKILQSGMQENLDSFRELCQQVCDVGLASLKDADAQKLVEVFVELESTFGPNAMIDRGFGFGPFNALILGLRLDNKENRERAVNAVLHSATVWLSGSVVITAWEDIERTRGDEGLSGDHNLLPNREAVQNAVAKWFEIADTFLQPSRWQSDSSSIDLSPYTLLCWMSRLRRDVAKIRALGEQFLLEAPTMISLFFGGKADHPEHSGFPLDMAWSILPAPDFLVNVASQSDEFSRTHSRLLGEIRAKASQSSEGQSGDSLQAMPESPLRAE